MAEVVPDARRKRVEMHREGDSLWEELRNAAETGLAVRRGEGEPSSTGQDWGADRQAPAGLISDLLAPAANAPKPRAVVLVGLRVTGRLNLESVELQAPLIAHNCYFDHAVNLSFAKAPQIQLTACFLPAVAADQLETTNNLDLSDSTSATVNLVGAHIGGDLVLTGVRLTGGSYPPDLGEGTLRPAESPTDRLDGQGLTADGMRVDQAMYCDEGDRQTFTSEGQVRMIGARIGGDLSFVGARLGQGLSAYRLVVEQAMFCDAGERERFTADGDVAMSDAQIEGDLSFVGALLTGDLAADRLRVEQDMSCEEGDRERFTAEGRVGLVGAHIGGDLTFIGARLAQGLAADRLRVEQAMFCREGERERFIAEGELGLTDAHIGGELSLRGARLDQGLAGEGLRVDQTMFCDQGAGEPFTAAGQVRLVGAHIQGDLTFRGACSETGLALDLTNARIDGDLSTTFAQARISTVDLTGARVGSLRDSATTWPTRLRLQGLVYAGLVEADDVGMRLRWIRRAEEGTREDPSAGAGYAAQPYTQLMSFYRREGRDGDARRVAYWRERRRRQELGRAAKLWSVFLQATVGFGYRPLRALAILCVLVLAGTLAFSSFHSDGDLTPIRDEHPSFVASMYTLDRLVPVFSLGLRDAFAPSGGAEWLAFAYTVLGWALTVAVAAGLSAAVRRD